MNILDMDVCQLILYNDTVSFKEAKKMVVSVVGMIWRKKVEG